MFDYFVPKNFYFIINQLASLLLRLTPEACGLLTFPTVWMPTLSPTQREEAVPQNGGQRTGGRETWLRALKVPLGVTSGKFLNPRPLISPNRGWNTV